MKYYVSHFVSVYIYQRLHIYDLDVFRTKHLRTLSMHVCMYEYFEYSLLYKGSIVIF